MRLLTSSLRTPNPQRPGYKKQEGNVRLVKNLGALFGSLLLSLAYSSVGLAQIEVGGQGQITPPPPPSGGVLTTLGTHLPPGEGWALVPGTDFNSWPDGQGSTVRYTTAEATTGGFQGASGSNCVLDAWSGMGFDPIDYEIFLTSGGHNCYFGNEVYVIDLKDISMVRANAAVAPGSPGDQPQVTHSYDELSYNYEDKILWSLGDSAQVAINGEVRGLNFSSFAHVEDSLSWSIVGDSAGNREYGLSAYDSVRNRIIFMNGRDGSNSTVRIFNPTTGAQTATFGRPFPFFENGNGRMYNGWFYYSGSISGVGRIERFNPDTGAFEFVTNMPGSLGIQSGWAIRGDDFYFWDGSDQVWIYDTLANTFQGPLTYGGSVPVDPFSPEARVFSKWEYLDELDAFVGYNNVFEGLWLYCPPGGCQPPVTAASFADRCAGPGVVLCQGLDTQAEIDPHISFTGFSNPAVSHQHFTSGGGSMRMDVLAGSPANTSGEWRHNFTAGTVHGGPGPFPVQYGEGDTFYVQWRQRFTPEFLNTTFDAIGGGIANGEKQVIIGAGDTPGNTASSCTDVEVVPQDTLQRGGPQMYHSCGIKDGKFEALEILSPGGGSIIDVQPNGPAYLNPCDRLLVPSDPDCVVFFANEWLTFTIRVKVGTWYNNDGNYCENSINVGGQTPGRICSEITFWMAREGQASVEILHRQDYDLTRGATSLLYGKIWLLPFHTNKDPAQQHDPGYMWYDEVIVSTNPIPDPCPTCQ